MKILKSPRGFAKVEIECPDGKLWVQRSSIDKDCMFILHDRNCPGGICEYGIYLDSKEAKDLAKALLFFANGNDPMPDEQEKK